ncbi:MAG: FKBP-type peptidyl-prolyl cis-trans isomerase [Bacteroidaceae bacterium]|nr:FKBP-type peptidyl-prolyl cis-trans isomerase [Bacteroidaceae bacterium]
MTLKKFIHYVLFVLAFPLLGLGGISCQENEEAGEYDNWQSRNQHYVDSIAQLANAGADGWSKMVAYTLVDSVENANPNNNHYIYFQKLESGTGTESPHYNDSIRIHYLGRLIPSTSYPQGYIFGKSYSAYTLNEATDVPALLAVKSNFVGVATAIMHMVEGDRWRIVVPYYIGSGESTNTSGNIPGYSALIFDIKLARIYKYKVDTNTSWH